MYGFSHGHTKNITKRLFLTTFCFKRSPTKSHIAFNLKKEVEDIHLHSFNKEVEDILEKLPFLQKKHVFPWEPEAVGVCSKLPAILSGKIGWLSRKIKYDTPQRRKPLSSWLPNMISHKGREPSMRKLPGHLYVYINIYVYTYKHIYTYIYMYNVYACVYIYIYTHSSIYICVCIFRTVIYIYIYIKACLLVCVYIYILHDEYALLYK